MIDEWQLAPKLWETIRFEVDHRRELGQFALTGSAVPADTKEITHSGTGAHKKVIPEITIMESVRRGWKKE